MRRGEQSLRAALLGTMSDGLEVWVGAEGVPYLTRDTPGPRTVIVTQSCPAAMLRQGTWRLEDFELRKQLYKARLPELAALHCAPGQLPPPSVGLCGAPGEGLPAVHRSVPSVAAALGAEALPQVAAVRAQLVPGMPLVFIWRAQSQLMWVQLRPAGA